MNLSAEIKKLHDKLDTILAAMEDISTVPPSQPQTQPVQSSASNTSAPAITSQTSPQTPGPAPPLTKSSPTDPEFTIPELESMPGHKNPVFQMMKNGKAQDLTVVSKDEDTYIDGEIWIDGVISAGSPPKVSSGTMVKIGQNDNTHTLDMGLLSRQGYQLTGHTCVIVVRASEDANQSNANPMQGQGAMITFDVV